MPKYHRPQNKRTNQIFSTGHSLVFPFRVLTNQSPPKQDYTNALLTLLAPERRQSPSWWRVRRARSICDFSPPHTWRARDSGDQTWVHISHSPHSVGFAMAAVKKIRNKTRYYCKRYIQQTINNYKIITITKVRYYWYIYIIYKIKKYIL